MLNIHSEVLSNIGPGRFYTVNNTKKSDIKYANPTEINSNDSDWNLIVVWNIFAYVFNQYQRRLLLLYIGLYIFLFVIHIER